MTLTIPTSRVVLLDAELVAAKGRVVAIHSIVLDRVVTKQPNYLSEFIISKASFWTLFYEKR